MNDSKVKNSASKKRKIDEEGRAFQEQWKLQYFFTEVKGKASCLICQETVSALKKYNIKRHYDSKHADEYDKFTDQSRKDMIAILGASLESLECENGVSASYAVSELLAKKLKPFSDGELIKECIDIVVQHICPEKKTLFSKVALSRRTVTRCVEELSQDIESTFKKKISDFDFYTIALDESTDISDTAQLAIFLRGIDSTFSVTEELAALVELQGTTTGKDIFTAVKRVMSNLDLKLEKLVGITTDGAPAMIGRHSGAVSLLEKEIKDLGIETDLYRIHFIIHQENLCAKSIKLQHVMDVIVQVVNFIRSRGLNHRQFKTFLSFDEAEYGDMLYFCDVRWLSRGSMLQRFYELREQISEFMVQKNRPVPELDDKDFLTDLAFLVDITSHLNVLNLKLQGKENLICDLYCHIRAFEVKLRLWKSQLDQGKLDHFPTLATQEPDDLSAYYKVIEQLLSEFQDRFADFRKRECDLNLFSNPFSVEVDTVPTELQMEVIDLLTNRMLLEKFNQADLLTFYQKNLPHKHFPKLATHAKKMIAQFGSTYLCEAVFSGMKIAKSKQRAVLTDSHLESTLRLATTSFKSDIKSIVKMEQLRVTCGDEIQYF